MLHSKRARLRHIPLLAHTTRNSRRNPPRAEKIFVGFCIMQTPKCPSRVYNPVKRSRVFFIHIAYCFETFLLCFTHARASRPFNLCDLRLLFEWLYSSSYLSFFRFLSPFSSILSIGYYVKIRVVASEAHVCIWRPAGVAAWQV